jgi:hypothetical protein
LHLSLGLDISFRIEQSLSQILKLAIFIYEFQGYSEVDGQLHEFPSSERCVV